MQSARPFCETMDAAVPKGERIAVDNAKFEQFMFYSLRKTAEYRSDAELVGILSSDRCHYAILLRERYERVSRAPPIDALSVLAEGRINRHEYVLVGPAAAAPDCSQWTLDGYHLGMGRTELFAIRSVTVHVDGQAQAIEPGKFGGVLVLGALNRLEKWDVVYDPPFREGLRAEMQERYGKPTSDVSGNISGDESGAVRQRRTIWRSTLCDAAIIVYENTSVRGAPVHSVQATLVRASILTPGFVEMKSLYP
jgi:hypothetical protein